MTRSKAAGLAGLLLSVLSASACAPSARPAPETTTTATRGDQSMQTARTPATAPTAMAIVEHEVASFDAWKGAFEGHADARAAGGVRSARVSRATDAPNTVTVCLVGGSAESLQAFLATPERRQAMQRAGVVGTPTITLAVPVEDLTVRDRALPGAFLRHRVDDFDAWKRGFDARAGARAKGGVVGHAIARAKDDPNDVIVLLQAESLDALRRFTGSEDLRAAMRSLGVRGEPRVTLVTTGPVER